MERGGGYEGVHGKMEAQLILLSEPYILVEKIMSIYLNRCNLKYSEMTITIWSLTENGSSTRSNTFGIPVANRGMD